MATETVTLRYPDDMLPRRVRRGVAEYVGRPGSTVQAPPHHVDFLLAHGWQRDVEGEEGIAALQAMSAKDLAAAIKAGTVDVDQARAAETSRTPEMGGPRTTVMDALASAAATQEG